MTATQSSACAGDDLPRLRPLAALVLSSIASFPGTVRAESEVAARIARQDSAQVEFENKFSQDIGSQPVDLSRFAIGNVVSPGTYHVDLHVGADWVGRVAVAFKPVPGTADAQPCFDESQLRRIGVDLGKLNLDLVKQIVIDRACLPISQVVTEAGADFDFGTQRLTLSIPQAALQQTARGYVAPDQWTSGVTAGSFGYDANIYSTRTQGGGTVTQGYLGVNAGFNAGVWHFRHNGSYTWRPGHGSRYRDISTYVQRDLPSLSSQLVIGETYTSGELFDSTSFRGVRLATDDRMLPDSLRGYAPVVRGVANSNATVTITQNGNVLYETTVAPGAFEISDLYPTGYGGDLRVAVNEADGTIRTFSIPYSAVPMSLRPGLNRYSFVLGVVARPSQSGKPFFAQATWQRGLTNRITGYGGVTVAQGYASALLGAALNTPLGALGADMTQASTVIPGIKRFSGSSIRISYAKRVETTGTNIAIAAYRYSTGGYFGLNDAVQARDAARNTGGFDGVWRERNRAALTLSQPLGERRGTLNITGSVANYWNHAGSDINYSAGYNNSFRNISFSISASRQRSQGGQSGTLYYASVIIPLGKRNRMTLAGNVSYGTDGRTQFQSSLSGMAGADSSLSYNLAANRSGGDGSTLNGSGSVVYRGPYAQIGASAGAGSDYQQGSISVRGGLVAHAGGITPSQPLSETFAIVEAPGAAGARLTQSSGLRVGPSGYAIVPYLTPYTLNPIELDPNGLSADVELNESRQQVAPRAGAIPLVRFATSTGRSALISARLEDDAPLPFGADVLDESGRSIGSVGQGSRVVVRGLRESGRLVVKWGDGNASSCGILYRLPPDEKPTLRTAGFRRITGVCTRVSIAPAIGQSMN
ncbi:fimbria/pilus outer membrane usher protein [Burkholderia lata]|uniref:Fimbrial protein n=1 Tax=Burkholderia lata (strain ATCC 17760 / DSM 23089 / LMG 22485 / NCIMB 9086 / R18194 / 383) TaxID=482957 RepID=A0A6P2SZ68_BURL3|nr:fimbria/pilus outer membrane usher protein [Burkholderia lata]VWC53651.1 fimbrial protein [Burkholderia lata]